MTKTLREHIAYRHKLTGYAFAEYTFLPSGPVATLVTKPPLLPVPVPEWLTAGAVLACGITSPCATVVEVSPEMCLISHDGKTWAAETAILAAHWRLAASEHGEVTMDEVEIKRALDAAEERHAAIRAVLAALEQMYEATERPPVEGGPGLTSEDHAALRPMLAAIPAKYLEGQDRALAEQIEALEIALLAARAPP